MEQGTDRSATGYSHTSMFLTFEMLVAYCLQRPTADSLPAVSGLAQPREEPVYRAMQTGHIPGIPKTTQGNEGHVAGISITTYGWFPKGFLRVCKFSIILKNPPLDEGKLGR